MDWQTKEQLEVKKKSDDYRTMQININVQNHQVRKFNFIVINWNSMQNM
jgi:hypothetical protein